MNAKWIHTLIYFRIIGEVIKLTVEELENEIKNLENRIEKMRNSMEKSIKQFIEAAKFFSAGEANKIFNSRLTKGEYLVEMEDEELKQLKLKCKNLIAEIPYKVEIELNKDKFWEHRKIKHTDEIDSHPSTIQYYDFKKAIIESLMNIFNQDFDKLISDLGYHNKPYTDNNGELKTDLTTDFDSSWQF